MADYMYIKFKGISGTSKQKGYEDFVEVMSFSHSASYGVSPGNLDSMGTAVAHTPFSVSVSLDKATIKMIETLNQRKAIDEVEFHMLTDDSGPLGAGAGGKKLIYKVTMTDTRIVGVDIGGADGAGVPTVGVAIAYATIEWDYDGAPTAHDFKNWAGA